RQRGAQLWVGRLKAGGAVRVPDVTFVHLYVATGAAHLDGAGQLGAGDAVRLTAAGNPALTADATQCAEVLIWEMDPLR
ncbi:MAG: pirin family protein, partial [Chloroflexota bacterium]|nr:pirin family protein [Chloroflexota bacterium]